MSEILRHHDNGEKLKLDVDVSQNLERVRQAAEKTSELSNDHIEQIRQQVEQRAISGQEITVGEREAAPAGDSFASHKQLKMHSYKRTLAAIQNRLKGPDKSFSKIIHKPVVDKASNLGAQTIARPAGLLGAGLVALIGSLFTLFLARHYGFRYNFFVFIVLLIVGYLLGSLVEMALRVFRRR